jgi:hypothetical protein
MEIVKPTWSSWSVLVYTGGLTVLGAAASALGYLSSQYGDAAYAGWSLVVLLILTAIALRFRDIQRVTAGVFAFVSVAMFVAFVDAVWKWWGWSNGASASSPFAGFHLGKLVEELLVLLAAVWAAKTFRFPLLVLWVATFSWLFVTDVLSSGGNWSAWVSIAVGFVLLFVGLGLDGGDRRPYGFWVHVVSGLTIGGALLYFWHSGNWHWSLIGISGLVFVWAATVTRRSSWAVLGALGILGAATHYTIEWWRHGVPLIQLGANQTGSTRGWVPAVVFAVAGFILVVIGIGVARRTPDD